MRASPRAEAVQDRYDPCPITPLVEVAFSRWTTPILWLLQHRGPLRFNQLRTELGSVTGKTLTQRLRQLERDGLVSRAVFPASPPRVEYEITDLGRSLRPLFRQMAGWSDRNMLTVRQARQGYDDAGRPRPA